MSKIFTDDEGNKYKLTYAANHGAYLLMEAEPVSKQPEVSINIYREHEWYGNRVAIKFPTRQGKIWISLDEYDLLKDAIANQEQP